MLIDLRGIGDELVLHFGGEDNKVDAEVFARSLLEFTLAIKAIDQQVNINPTVDIFIEAINPGSVRAWVKAKANPKTLSSLAGVTVYLVLEIFAGQIADRIFDDPNQVTVTINEDHVIVESEHFKVIQQKENYQQGKAIKKNPEIEKRISNGFRELNESETITDFGIAKNTEDEELTIRIPKQEFERIANDQEDYVVSDDARYRDEKVVLTIIRGIFERGKRKWEFIRGDGITVSASILSDEFFDKLESREYVIGIGDRLEVLLRTYQERDEINDVWVNKSYEVIEVSNHVPGVRQRRMNLNDPST